MQGFWLMDGQVAAIISNLGIRGGTLCCRGLFRKNINTEGSSK
jgi:hypothetical protein